MKTSLSNLVNNLIERINRIKLNVVIVFLNLKESMISLQKINAYFAIKIYSDKMHEELKNQFKKELKFSNKDINKFILLLRKGVYPYEYISL